MTTYGDTEAEARATFARLYPGLVILTIEPRPNGWEWLVVAEPELVLGL